MKLYGSVRLLSVLFHAVSVGGGISFVVKKEKNEPHADCIGSIVSGDVEMTLST